MFSGILSLCKGEPVSMSMCISARETAREALKTQGHRSGDNGQRGTICEGAVGLWLCEAQCQVAGAQAAPLRALG